MGMNKSKQATQGISWRTVFAVLGSIAVLVGSIVSGLDFINHLREGYQQFLWLGLAVLGVIWLILLWLLFKQGNIYWPLYLMVTILAGVVFWIGWRSYVQTRGDKLVVLIAKFDGPEEVYGLRNEIYEKLSEDFLNNDDVLIETINEVITPDSNSDSPRARELGKRFQADVVIWGWYRPTENPNVTIHIENLTSQDVLPLRESTTVQPSASLAELDDFSFQQQVGQETSALIWFLTGLIDYGTEDYVTAIERFDKALNVSPALSQIINNQADIYFSRANAYYKGDDVQHAIQDYEHAIQIDPQYAKAYNNRGIAYTDLDEYQRAIQDYEYVIQIEPEDVAAYNNRGLAYADLGEYQRAIQDYEHAIQIDPQVADPYYNRGLAYAGLGEYQRAIDDFERAIQIDPEYMEAYICRGNSYAELEEYELAIQDYGRAIKLDTQNADAYYNRGIAFGNIGEYQLAIQDFDRAIKFSPMYADAYYNRGVVNRALGKIAEAEADFKRYEELTGQKP